MPSSHPLPILLAVLMCVLPDLSAAATRTVSVIVTGSGSTIPILTIADDAEGPTPTVDADGTHHLAFTSTTTDHIVPLRRCPVVDRLLIDVRTPQEYDDGHYPDAILIEYQLIVPTIYRYTSRRDQRLELYCRSGNRAGTAQDTLEATGFTEVINLGGYAPSGSG